MTTAQATASLDMTRTEWRDALDLDPVLPFHTSERAMLLQHDKALIEGAAVLKVVKWAIPIAISLLALILTTNVMGR